MNSQDVQMRDYNSNTVQNLVDSIPKIRVVVRKRPLNKKETQKNETDIIETRNSNQLIVKELRSKIDLTKYIEEHNFTFDQAYDESTTNEMIYLEAVRPLIEAAFNRTKVTCFAYGQTGSGKTYTMMGPSSNALEMGTPGLYLLSAFDIFSLLDNEKYNHLEIWVSFYEIYCGKLFDLFNDRNLLHAREDGRQNICIVGLTEKHVTNLTEMMQLIEYGLKARTVGITGANNDSSRSHGIIQIAIKQPNGSPHGKISFIDLAGSERAADTIDTNKQTRMDGAEINKSLLALKECIRALDQDKKHTPFRGSKLTLVLRDSFMGNCKTLMIGNISPCSSCSEHTLNTLRYADRVKELRGKDKEKSGAQDGGDTGGNAKDPQEMLSNLLMMPRQHNKTVKYNVDKNGNPVRNSMGQKCSGPALNKKQVNHNQASNANFFNSNSNITSNTKSNASQHPNQFSLNSQNKENANYNQSKNLENQLYNLLNKNKGTSAPNQTQGQKNMPNSATNFGNSTANNFISNYTSYNINRESGVSMISSNSHNPLSVNDLSSPNEEDLQKLQDRHEKLINRILIEEESYIENHRKHVDQLVEVIKEEMGAINDVEKAGSDIEQYINTMEKLYTQQIEKISFMKTRLLNFKSLVREEAELSDQFHKMSETITLNRTNTFDNQLASGSVSHISRSDVKINDDEF